MSKYLLYGVKASTMKEAHAAVSTALKTHGESWENDSKGEYYTYGEMRGEDAELVSGIYQDEDGPFPSERAFPNWKFLLYVNESPPNSKWVSSLDGLPEIFVKLRDEDL